MGRLWKSAAALIMVAIVGLVWGIGAGADEALPMLGLQTVSVNMLAEAEAEFRAASNEPSKWVCVEIGASSFSIRYGDQSTELSNCDESPLAYVLCDRAAANSGIGENSTIVCNNCRLVLPDGTAADAMEVLFDAESGKLTLVGTEEQPVTVTLANGTAIAAMSGSRLTMEISGAKKKLTPASPVSTPLASRF